MFQKKIVEKIRTQSYGQQIVFPRKSCVYEIMSKYMVQPDRPWMAVCITAQGFACWITKSTDTLRICNTYYVFKRQQRLRKRCSMLHIVQCLSCFFFYHDDCMQFIYVKTAQQSLMYFSSGRILKEFAPLLVLQNVNFSHGCSWQSQEVIFRVPENCIINQEVSTDPNILACSYCRCPWKLNS